MQRFSSVLGLGLLIGGVLTKKSIGALGAHGHTTVTHYTAIISNLLVGLVDFPAN